MTYKTVEFLTNGKVGKEIGIIATLDFLKADIEPQDSVLMGEGIQEDWKPLKKKVLRTQKQAVPI